MKLKTGVVLLLMSAFFLSACGGAAQVTPTPTVDINALHTAAAETVVASLTQTAVAFTSTPQPATATPGSAETSVTSTALPTQTAPPLATQALCDDLAYVADATIPDGFDRLLPNQEFTKTWVVKNTGTCTWAADYKLVFGYGERMGGQPVPIGIQVPPGVEVEISVTLRAPAISGSYTGAWRLSNSQGFPFGEFLTVVIVIK